MLKPKTIAIDGPVSAGKSVIGSLLATKLGYLFVDTGMMYRALTWRALQLRIALNDEESLGRLAAETDIHVDAAAGADKLCHVFIDGHDVSKESRKAEVEKGVSLVSKIAGVRKTMLVKQRKLAAKGKVVMAGRDIGTVVLPDAKLKIYLSASPEERASRRYLEMLERGEKASYNQVLADLKSRDKLDIERSAGPLRPAIDAKIVNTDNLDVEQVLAKILEFIKSR